MEYNKNIKCPQCGTEIDPGAGYKEERSTKKAESKSSNMEREIHPASFFKILWLKKIELWILIFLFILLIVFGFDRLLTGRIHLWIDILYITGYIIFTAGSLKGKKFITLADVISSLLQALFWPTLFCIKYAMGLEDKESLYRIILYVNKREKNKKEVSYYE
jgi:hypothetical protein